MNTGRDSRDLAAMAIVIPGADSRNRVGDDVDRLLPVLSQTDNLGTLDLCLGNFHPVLIKVPSLRVTVTSGAIRGTADARALEGRWADFIVLLQEPARFRDARWEARPPALHRQAVIR